MRPAPKVWLGPSAPPPIAVAIEDGGGSVGPIEDANVIVWCSEDHDISAVGELLNPGIEWVQVDAAGVDHWIEAGVINSERIWTSARGVYGAAVAEHVMAMLLVACRRLHEAARASSWKPLDGELLAGKTVGVLGAGGIGSEVIARLAPFGVRIIAVSQPGGPIAGADLALGPDGIPQLLEESDLVVAALPLTPDTRGLIGARELDLLGSRGWLINVGRGAVVDSDALVAAVGEKRIAGACLDVTDPEPLPDGHPLWLEPDVLITSHSANTMAMAMEAYARLVVENLRRFQADEELLGIVNLGRGY